MSTTTLHRCLQRYQKPKPFTSSLRGSGLYIDAVLRGYKLLPVPENPELRGKLDAKPMRSWPPFLASYKDLHNTTDLDYPQKNNQAIEIEDFYSRQPTDPKPFPLIKSVVLV
jgi:tRNA dimethylallyltransferase